MEAIATAKVNLSLRVGARRDDGLHEVAGIFQSVGWTDHLTLESGEPDGITSTHSQDVPAGDQNLAWQAVLAVRKARNSSSPVRLVLDKRLPVAAGLGGGSADAAAGLALAGRLLGLPPTEVAQLASGLGSDVPFCWRGGTALVTGGGEGVLPIDIAPDFALAIVVPPIEVSTGAVYAKWDQLDGPAGFAISGSDLPPSLRTHGPLVNDLFPAAVAVAPQVEEWRAELVTRFERPVFLSGSGPSLVAFFVDEAEASDALGSVPAGARTTWSGFPLPFGWAIRDGEGAAVSDSRGASWTEEEAARWEDLEWSA